jgi:hypothetical protein
LTQLPLPTPDPCPVCGSTSVELDWEGEVFVACRTCGFEGTAAGGSLKSRDEIERVIANWNRLPRLASGEADAMTPEIVLSTEPE